MVAFRRGDTASRKEGPKSRTRDVSDDIAQLGSL
jgi:hypothetical protein